MKKLIEFSGAVGAVPTVEWSGILVAVDRVEWSS